MFGWTVDTANPTKPQLVTEYDVAGLNPFAAEQWPLMLAIGGLQDWAGVFAFCYRANGPTDAWLQHPSHKILPLHYEGEFSTKLATVVPFARAWARRDVSPGRDDAALVVTRSYQGMLDDALGSCPGGGRGAVGAQCTALLADYAPGGASWRWQNQFVAHRVGLVLGACDADPAGLAPLSLLRPIVSDTGQSVYNFQNKSMTVSTPSTLVFMGRTPSGGNVTLGGGVSLRWGATRDSYGVAVITSLDKEAPIATASTLLVTVTTWAENTRLVWENRTAGRVGDWGEAPVVVGTPPVFVRLPGPSPWRCFALASDGSRMAPINSTTMISASGVAAVFALNAHAEERTLWWAFSRPRGRIKSTIYPGT